MGNAGASRCLREQLVHERVMLINFLEHPPHPVVLCAQHATLNQPAGRSVSNHRAHVGPDNLRCTEAGCPACNSQLPGGGPQPAGRTSGRRPGVTQPHPGNPHTSAKDGRRPRDPRTPGSLHRSGACAGEGRVRAMAGRLESGEVFTRLRGWCALSPLAQFVNWEVYDRARGSGPRRWASWALRRRRRPPATVHDGRTRKSPNVQVLTSTSNNSLNERIAHFGTYS